MQPGNIVLLSMEDLEEDFDDDLAKSFLEISFDRVIHPQEAVAKSLYNFDLDSMEGVDRLLELLPILDPDVINEVYQEVFPGYPVDNLVPRMARMELRGYFMDYLEINEPREAEPTQEAEPGNPEPDSQESEPSSPA